jgi:3-oxoacyl-[acyl-carrier-protein] synthase II
LISALGSSREAVWEHMLAGLCGIRPVTLFDTTGFRSRIAAEVDLFPLTAQLTSIERRRWSRSDQLGVLATREALDDSGLLDSGSGLERHRIGVSLGAGTGDLLRNEDYYFTMLSAGIDRARPSGIYNHFSNTPVDVIASHFDLTGLRACFVSACSSSTIAIGHAAEAIADGQLDAAVCGGTDALARLTFSGFNALRLMDPEPCRPFDATRAGMSIGEGASILVLEEYEHARKRGAHIYAELTGYSLSCEAFHPTAPEPEGRPVARVIERALADARANADDVDHVNAHGTATAQNDVAEARGFRRIFGERGRLIPVTSIKSMIGHCLGASGAVEAAVTALTVSRGVIPPTIHHEETDSECAVEVVANLPREARVRCAVSMSLGFGGNDSAIVLRAVET